MENKVEIKHKEWLSTAGFKQEHWSIKRNDWELGTVGLSYNHKWTAIITSDCGKQYRSKQFVKFDTAVKWLVHEMINIRPISELNSLI